MQTNDVCKFLSAFAQLDVRKPLLLKLAVREVAKRGHELDVTQLAEFLHVFSKFDVTKPTIKLLSVLRNNIASKQWSIEECQKLPLLSTRSTTGKHAPFSYTKGATIAGTNIGEQDRNRGRQLGRSLATVFHSMGRLKYRDEDLLSTLIRPMARNLPLLETTTIATIADSVLLLKYWENEFFVKRLTEEILHRCKELTVEPKALATVLQVLEQSPFFQQFWIDSRTTTSSSSSGSGRQKTLPSCMKRRTPFDGIAIAEDVQKVFLTLLELLPNKLPHQRNQWDPKILARILRAYARFRPEDLLSPSTSSEGQAAEQLTESKNESPPPQVEPLFRHIGDVLALKGPSLDTNTVVTACWSFAQQGISHGVFFYNVPRLFASTFEETDRDMEDGAAQRRAEAAALHGPKKNQPSGACSTAQLISIAHSYSLLGMANTHVFDALTLKLCHYYRIKQNVLSLEKTGPMAAMLADGNNYGGESLPPGSKIKELHKNLEGTSNRDGPETEIKRTNERKKNLLPLRTLLPCLQAYLRVSLNEPAVFREIAEDLVSAKRKKELMRNRLPFCVEVLQVLREVGQLTDSVRERMDITVKEMQEFDKGKKMKKLAGSTNKSKRAFCPTFLSTAKNSPVLQLSPADDIKDGSRDGKKGGADTSESTQRNPMITSLQ
ncbi:unnamed protein product [Amoebophrya sp. A120]|nr:unnamed protein product [Amoebophrya sp. A120]|eukprot:GSA120T00020026001.1